MQDIQSALSSLARIISDASDVQLQASSIRSSLNDALSQLSQTKKNVKRTLIYAAGNVNYPQFVQDYANRGGVTAIGPQVYGLDDKGSITNNLSTTFPYNDPTFASKAKRLGIDIIPLIAAGSGLGSNFYDTGIQAVINNPSSFASALVALCKNMGYPEVQLDWETGLPSSVMSLMTSALTEIASAMHEAGLKVSLTTYLSNYQNVYNTWQLAAVLDYLNIQAYTSDFTTFENTMNAMLGGIPEQFQDRLQMGMGDYPNVNPSIAGFCIQLLLTKGIQSLALWPEWGSELSNASYGFIDSVYNCYNWNELCSYFFSN